MIDDMEAKRLHPGATIAARALAVTSALTLALALLASGARAQMGGMSVDGGGVGLRVIGLATEARPALLGENRREYYLTQPMLFLHDPGTHLSSQTMLDFEAWTLEDGELNAGMWGEGFVDKRHPHTFLHELVFSLHDEPGGWDYSLTGGRGFAPFGSDDPMVRPFVKYPANHHLAQILERWVVIGALNMGSALALEAGIFNGDEPTGPRSRGETSRLGDSRAGRITLWPANPLELQVSHAWVESPEHVDGGGLDHRKWHASGRLEVGLGRAAAYALVEWARTDEYTQDEQLAFSFASTLAEAAVTADPIRVALRWERTTRPEEERLEDLFRTARPHADENVIGVTRWRNLSLHVAASTRGSDFTLSPFVEVSRLTVQEIGGGVFDPDGFYGAGAQWSLSAGVELLSGVLHSRAGRYGAARQSALPMMRH